MAERAAVIRSVSRGLETISINGGNRTQVAAARALQNSATRTERSWRAVGKSLRNEMRKHPKSR